MQLLFLVSLIGFVAARPQVLPLERDLGITGCVTSPVTGIRYCGGVIVSKNGRPEDTISNRNAIGVDGLDINGCLVGPSGERVCPQGAFGSDGRTKTTFRGNQGPEHTGSNGNAGPVNAAGQPVDPAAETYRKQIEQYQRWAEQQVQNAKHQLGTA